MPELDWLKKMYCFNIRVNLYANCKIYVKIVGYLKLELHKRSIPLEPLLYKLGSKHLG